MNRRARAPRDRRTGITKAERRAKARKHAKKGGAVTALKYDHEHFVEIGREGGQQNSWENRVARGWAKGK